MDGLHFVLEALPQLSQTHKNHLLLVALCDNWCIACLCLALVDLLIRLFPS